MKKIRCASCFKKWYVDDEELNFVLVCPYCASQIKQKCDAIGKDTLGKVIYKAIMDLGLDILDSPIRISGYLLDMAPELRKEIRIFSKIFNEEYLSIFKAAFDQELKAAETTINKLKNLFVEEEALSEKWADKLCENCMMSIKYYKRIGMSDVITAEIEDVQIKVKNNVNELQSYNYASRITNKVALNELKRKRDEIKSVSRALAIAKSIVIGIKDCGELVLSDVLESGSRWIERYLNENNTQLINWTDIIEVGISDYSGIVGVKSDGKILTVGTDSNDKKKLLSWENIVSIAACDIGFYGLRNDGTVMMTNECFEYGHMFKLNNLSSIACRSNNFIGLKFDGTVLAIDESLKRELSEWNDIIEIATSNWHTVGLRRDGTVIAAGANNDGECEVSEWDNIVAIAASDRYTLGLKVNGMVVATQGVPGREYVGKWTDIVGIFAGGSLCIGLKSDGTLVVAGSNYDFSNWKLFETISDYGVINRKKKKRSFWG